MQILLGTEKKESKKTKLFRNYSSRLAQSPKYNREGRARTREKLFKTKLTKNYANLEILVPSYLNNPSEEIIFENNRINEGHETMTLQNEEVTLKNT